VDHGTRIEAVAGETAAVAATVRDGPLDVRVPTCPDWSLGQLIDHVGGFTGFWTHVLCEGTGRPKTPAPDMPDAADGAAVAEWYEALAGHLLDELWATPPDTEVWTWAPADHTAGFVARRCAHELSVHRTDAQRARGRPDPIDAAVAADGIDEIFFMITNWDGGGGAGGSGQTLHLHGTDRGDEWLIALQPDGLSVERSHGKADLALRGAVADLEMVLYQRPPLGEVERVGDEQVLDAWYRTFTFG
jgi:uncharacterized protein (TIGR03083 family)